MAVVTRYVNTAAGAGGDGTTNATSSGDGTHAYVSLSAWEASEETNLVTDTDTHIVNCTGTSADTTKFAIFTWTTNATYFITVNGENTTGAYSTSDYRLETSTAGGYENCFDIREDYTVVNDIQLQHSVGHSSSNGFFVTGATDPTFNRCISKAVVTAGSFCKGFSVDVAGLKMAGCLAYDWTGSSHVGVLTTSGSPTPYVYNTTVDNCTAGFQTGGSGAIIRNSVAQNCGTNNGFIGTWASGTSHNASDDTSDAPGTSPQTGTVTFVDLAGEDYQPASGDTVIKENGVDLSGTFDFDLAGNSWPATWSIGCLIPAVAATGGIRNPFGGPLSMRSPI